MILEDSKFLLLYFTKTNFMLKLHNIIYNNNDIYSKREFIAVAIKSNDSNIYYANKFGTVYVVELNGINEGKVSPFKTIELLFYYDSLIITSLVR